MSRIALVDDDRNILTSVSMTLEAEGFEVETYNDGQAALDAFNKKAARHGCIRHQDAADGWHGPCCSGCARKLRCPSFS